MPSRVGLQPESFLSIFVDESGGVTDIAGHSKTPPRSVSLQLGSEGSRSRSIGVEGGWAISSVEEQRRDMPEEWKTCPSKLAIST